MLHHGHCGQAAVLQSPRIVVAGTDASDGLNRSVEEGPLQRPSFEDGWRIGCVPLRGVAVKTRLVL